MVLKSSNSNIAENMQIPSTNFFMYIKELYWSSLKSHVNQTK